MKELTSIDEISNLPCMKERTKHIISVIACAFIMFSFIQTDSTQKNLGRIKSALSRYLSEMYPQKIYVHTDKSNYFANEHIWIKAYLFNAESHEADEKSNHIYVELINPKKIAVQAIRIKMKNGTGKGSFFLQDTITEGIYQIRSYTNRMKNFGSEFFFTKNIEVRNEFKKLQITPKEAKWNNKNIKKLKKNTLQYTIKFFPEGGELLEGLSARVAFKAVNNLGGSADAHGVVKNNKKEVVALINSQHDGMGSFDITPQKNETYTAYIKFNDHRKVEKYEIPNAVQNKIGMKLQTRKNKIFLEVRSNKPPSNDRPANEILIIGHVRGKMYYQTSVNLLDGDSNVSIDESIFPSGIIHFTLFNNRLLPVAERLHFILHDRLIHFSITTQKINDTLELNLESSDESLNDHTFYASLSTMLIDSEEAFTSPENIITKMLLSSDLDGYIENPSYYLDQSIDSVKRHSELLMLTHGWSRFSWSDILENKEMAPEYNFEKGITIEGRITRELFDIPYPGASVKLYIQSSYNDEFETSSGEKGYFKFENLNYYDTVEVKIVTRKSGGGKNLLIDIGQDNDKTIVNYQGNFFSTSTSAMDMSEYRRRKGEEIREMQKKRQKELDSIFSESIHGTPDHVIWGHELSSSYSNLLDAMRGRVPGVDITGNSMIIRGRNTIYGSTDPLLLIDGMPTDFSVINSIPVEDVDRIEILKGPSAAIYGSRGANGVVAIYTKRGQFMKKGEIAFSMLGYHKAERFSMPSEQRINDRKESGKYPLTIYWNPDLQLINNNNITILIPLKAEGKFITVLEGTDMKGNFGSEIMVFEY
ncbi:MAG: TonB-dependent receptor plug domain-containing protein [Bacteroidales bacterium]|nr:TonB-dependent receptor plug domain-containing protein [Bacteroidales bacterium]